MSTASVSLVRHVRPCKVLNIEPNIVLKGYHIARKEDTVKEKIRSNEFIVSKRKSLRWLDSFLEGGQLSRGR